MSGDYMEWKLIREQYEEFISYLRSLSAPPVPPKCTTRDNPGTKAGQGRDNPGTDPGQKRDNAGQTDQEPPKTSANPENPEFEIPKPPGTPGTNDPSSEPSPKPPLDPKAMTINDYISAYFDQHGPPPRESLDKKPVEFQRYILALVENIPLREAERKLLLPPPYGPYIATSKSALSRLRTRFETREAKRNKRAIKKHINELLSQPDLPDADVTRVTEQLLKLKLVESGLHPEPDLTQTKTLVEMLEKIRAGKLAERKVHLAESKQ